MTDQNIVLKQSVSFPRLNEHKDDALALEVETDSVAESDIEHSVVAISFQHDKTKGTEPGKKMDAGGGVCVDQLEGQKTDSMKGYLYELLDGEETDVGKILKTAAEKDGRIRDHLAGLEKKAVELYNHQTDVSDDLCLSYMTTESKELDEIDGIILRHYYLERFTWKSDLLLSLRILCARLYFKGESQNLDMMIHSFANNWYSRFNQPSFIYCNIIGVYLVTYALILLNTDMHHDNVKSESFKLEKTPTKKSGSLYDIFSYDTFTSKSSVDNATLRHRHASKSSNVISKNEFVLNTMAAMNDNFVMVNPVIISKQLRLYYTSISQQEIVLPRMSDGEVNVVKNTISQLRLETVERARRRDEDDESNDEVGELVSIDLSLKKHRTKSSCASSTLSLELVSGTLRNTEGSFGYLKNTERPQETQVELDEEVLMAPPFMKEGLQKVVIRNWGDADEAAGGPGGPEEPENVEQLKLLFKKIPAENRRRRMHRPGGRSASAGAMARLLGKDHRYENEFELKEYYVAVSEGEVRIFEIDKDPGNVNSYDGHGRGRWTDWAKCICSVDLCGCYAEVIGSSRRTRSQKEDRRVHRLFSRTRDDDAYCYWKLELPYSMVDTGIGPTGCNIRTIVFRGIGKGDHDVSEFCNACNYWAGMLTRPPGLREMYDAVAFSSVEYGFSKRVVDSVCGGHGLPADVHVAVWDPVWSPGNEAAAPWEPHELPARLASQIDALAAQIHTLSAGISHEREIIPLMGSTTMAHNHRHVAVWAIRCRRKWRVQRDILLVAKGMLEKR